MSTEVVALKETLLKPSIPLSSLEAVGPQVQAFGQAIGESMKSIGGLSLPAETLSKLRSDYVAQAGTLTFLPGDLSKTITVQVNKDATTEPNQAFTVNLSAPTNATLLVGGSSGTGTIQNDD